MSPIPSHLSPLMSSAKGDWNTPDNLLELVREVGPIGLDPASDESNPTRAVEYFTPDFDGLTPSWNVGGLVYVNPPYGRPIASWAQKMREEGERGVEIIALLPARPDARWWHDNITTAARVCFWRGRLRFKGAPSSAPFPSAVAYWGPRARRFREVFSPHGWVVAP